SLADEFRSSIHTYFILDNLETLRKNGRLSGVKALVVSTLNIKPIMMGNKGVIQQRSQSVGMKKALSKLADIVNEEVKNKNERTLIITHCNAPERAELLKKLLLERAEFKKVCVLDTRGVSSMYANDGGIIVTA
ncbi:MAG: DegV family EDD domain-containing protein, partial [Lachnospiraceae bacterium]|nr:DegV family EDD domain-containing protein [Lachnospiraceae bacterium]